MYHSKERGHLELFTNLASGGGETWDSHTRQQGSGEQGASSQKGAVQAEEQQDVI